MATGPEGCSIIAEFGSSIVRSPFGFETWLCSAAAAGATHVKVQLFRAEHFPPVEQAGKRRLEFPRARLPEFVEMAHRYGVKAGASVFDAEAVELAAEYCDFLKLAAREQDNQELAMHALNKSIVNTLTLYRSVSDLKYRWLPSGFAPGITLWAIQAYPAPMPKSLVMAWRAWRNGIDGWSSHTTGALDCILAARLGASVLEKHFALEAGDVEAGHSLLPAAFRRMTNAIRLI